MTITNSWSEVLEKPAVAQPLEEIPSILWNLKVPYHIHKNL
jgi:hypothetical protein